MTFTIFEQPWTQTLEISEAMYTPSEVALSTVSVVTRDSPIKLDAKNFAEFSSKLEKKALGADGHGTYNPEAKKMLGADGHGTYNPEAKKMLGADGHGTYNPAAAAGKGGGIWTWLKKKMRMRA